jgi:hypothetical protein
VASVTALAPSTGHLALRPVAQRIGRLPAAPDSEVETTYQFRAVGRAGTVPAVRPIDPFDPAGPICVVDSGLVVDPVYSVNIPE